MNVWAWKKNKIVTSGWFYYYDSDVRDYVFSYDDFIIKEDLAKKMSFGLIDKIRLYILGTISYELLLDSLTEESRLNGINFVDTQHIISLLDGIKG